MKIKPHWIQDRKAQDSNNIYLFNSLAAQFLVTHSMCDLAPIYVTKVFIIVVANELHWAHKMHKLHNNISG